jgi:hypothetical protein
MPTMWDFTVDGDSLDGSPAAPTGAYDVWAFYDPKIGASACSVLITYGQNDVTPPAGWTTYHLVAGASGHMNAWVATTDAWSTGDGDQWHVVPDGSGDYQSFAVSRGYSFAGGSGLAWANPAWNQDPGTNEYSVQWEPPGSTDGVWFQFVAATDVDTADDGYDLTNLPGSHTWVLVGDASEPDGMNAWLWVIGHPGIQAGGTDPSTLYPDYTVHVGESIGSSTATGSNPETIGIAVWALPAVGPESTDPGGMYVGGE